MNIVLQTGALSAQMIYDVCRMPVHHLWESHGSSLPDLHGIQSFLQPYGRRKANFEAKSENYTDCGTDYRVLNHWFIAVGQLPESYEGWKRGDEFEYVFVFHECKIPQDADLNIQKLNFVGCSFHPKLFVEA
jgi:hypothetical protein